LGGQQELGIEIHQEVQKERQRELGDAYTAERPVEWTFEHRGYSIRVSGRIDGLISEDGTCIEEIKSTFDIRELRRRIHSYHPYVLQLRTYGYLYRQETGENADLNLMLVSSRTRKTDELHITLDLPDYENWLQLRLDQIADLAAASAKTLARRKKAAKKLKFPFERPRLGQKELIAAVVTGLTEKKQLLLQAPTGLGKTMGVLYPALKEALGTGQRVMYITPKNSQHGLAEEAAERLRTTASGLRTLQMTAKSKICMKPEPVCNPAVCEYARKHHDKVAQAQIHDRLAKKKVLDFKTFRKIAVEHEVCPYELQFEAAPSCDIVIADYHYALAGKSRLTHPEGPEVHGLEGLPILIIDEGHNLPARAMEAYSASLSIREFERLSEESDSVPAPFQEDFQDLASKVTALIRSTTQTTGPTTSKIELDPEPYSDLEGEFTALLTRYLQEDTELEAGDPILQSTYRLRGFVEALEHLAAAGKDGPFFCLQESDRAGGWTIRVVCSDASAFLAPLYREFSSVVAFSATLKPFSYFRSLGGFSAELTHELEFNSPFDPRQRKILIIPQVSTRFSKRESNREKIGLALVRICAAHPGNYFAFFPSFDFMERFSQGFTTPRGFQLLKQTRGMRKQEVEDWVKLLKETPVPTLVLAVQGGVFSEGVDYPGKTIIGAFVIGPPLPHFSAEQEEKKAYYQRRYGNGEGFAYTYPAMARAIQAAGRVIRTETDRGVIVLMDDRFLSPKYAASMPTDWFNQSPTELVSNSILRDLEIFWSDNTSQDGTGLPPAIGN
jgi:DNA excision repair protein ERCC-2